MQSVNRLITRFSAANDHDSCVSLRMCSLVCLSNLGELYHILSHHPLWRLPAVAVKQHEQTMYRMSDVSKELMNDNDMRHLPPYAGVRHSKFQFLCAGPGVSNLLIDSALGFVPRHFCVGKLS